MNVRLPLYLKILAWFFLNIALVAVALLMVGQLQFRFGMDALIAGTSGDRLQAVSDLFSAELRASPQTEWAQIVKRFSAKYGVAFFLFKSDGTQIAGDAITLPPDVKHRLQERPTRPGMPPPQGFEPGGELDNPPGFPPERAGPLPARGEEANGGPRDVPPRTMVHTRDPSLYWLLMRLPPLLGPSSFSPPDARPLTLIAESRSINGGGFFFEIAPWLYAGIGVLALSLVLWIPLMRGITQAIAKMNAATQKIAAGAFDTRVKSTRHDELGSLAQSINHMAERLEGFVAGQKRFLGDIAHELCTPIARMQMAMGILEQRGGEVDAQSVEDLREELQEMSLLVNELLSFSKASLGARALERKAVGLRALIEKVIRREIGGATKVENTVPENIQVLAEADLLQRALANLVRNALRHAGEAGPVGFSASGEPHFIRLTVWDRGPGIPDEALTKVFDPFYRVDSSRDRETGGVGLGLAIVKTCVEGCGGTITCQNRTGGGAEFVLCLPKVEN